MLDRAIDLRPPLLAVSPSSDRFKTAVGCWNEYLSRLKDAQNPDDFEMQVEPLSREVQFHFPVSRVFSDGIVESTRLADGQHNGWYQLSTLAVIDNKILEISGPLYNFPNVEEIRRHIAYFREE